MIMDLFDRLFPIHRSITGNGVRESLAILNEIVPIEQKEYPSGMECYDWTVPKEWNVREAFIRNKWGDTIVDIRDNNLHLVSYSTPFHGRVSREELLSRIYTLPEMPDAIPYVTSYYKEHWGFCLEHNRLKQLVDDQYEVVIDSTLEDGHMTIGEGVVSGSVGQEILFSTYICHPSMANNELSGPIVQTMIYKYLRERGNLKYNYRFLYLPETIGSVLYLSQYGEPLKEKLAAGYVITCVGHGSSFTYKKSKRGHTLADRAAIHVLQHSGKPHRIIEWSPFGSDERQYGSQAFQLPVGSLMRTMYGDYKEYHTSLDNRDLISEEALQETVQMYIDIIETLEANETYQSTHIHCEPKLDKRGLYPSTGGTRSEKERKQVSMIMHLLAYSDGEHDLIAIGDKFNTMGKDLAEAAALLVGEGLLVPISAVN
ncbi:DUF4910 domain-containing protein [Paenibacillus sp. J2TS4]|uniref:DUF4910 domain-containing protein n=1 Tax=Paenibacillus sp. J2TS4 TaxID=2807194 RepID=UPI001B27AF5F|nr:DUF4910 domain-containing protein [Paenibacillus sp. J2TS4]GIP36205.1 aminopeptidase [Paenibacillus sp. J2TS4]